MFDEHDIVALLAAYVEGDTLARKALVDALDEAGDPRAEQFREEAIDWDGVALGLAGKKLRSNARYRTPLTGPAARLRFRIDCARFGSPTTPEVTEAVRAARRAFVAGLFPDLEL